MDNLFAIVCAYGYGLLLWSLLCIVFSLNLITIGDYRCLLFKGGSTVLSSTQTNTSSSFSSSATAAANNMHRTPSVYLRPNDNRLALRVTTLLLPLQTGNLSAAAAAAAGRAETTEDEGVVSTGSPLMTGTYV